jgi:ubiquinone/menaquinone biosynthesis C-methylase UbiE
MGEHDMTISDQRNEDAIRSAVHGMWDGVAGHWAERADEVEERGVVVTAAMLDRVELHPGDDVLELACGPGGAGLAAAARVGPTGTVLLSDVAPQMVAVAGARAEQQGIHNVATAVLDLEQIDQPDDRFEVVLCREGLMFAVDPARAAAEIRRVLRPGGRLAAALWASSEQNPWLGLVFDAVSAETGFPVPPPGIPGPFSLTDPEAVRRILTTAGFRDVEVDEVASPVRAPTFEAWWARTSALAGPLATILAGLPDEVTEAVTTRLQRAVEPYVTPAGLELPGVTLLAFGRCP